MIKKFPATSKKTAPVKRKSTCAHPPSLRNHANPQKIWECSMIRGPSGLLQIHSGTAWPLVTWCRLCAARKNKRGMYFLESNIPDLIAHNWCGNARMLFCRCNKHQEQILFSSALSQKQCCCLAKFVITTSVKLCRS